MSNTQFFTGQSAFRIRLDTGVDLVANPTMFRALYYRRPDGSSGSWPASITSGSPRMLEYNGQEGDFPQGSEGLWKTWSFVRFVDGRDAPGKAVSFRVLAEGQ